MPRFTNEFGSVVNVDEATAKQQGENWTAEKSAESKPASKSTKK